MLGYNSEEYFVYGVETANAIEKILAPDIVWSDWIKGTQGFVTTDKEQPTLYPVEQIVDLVEFELNENPDKYQELEEEEQDALNKWMLLHGVDLEEAIA